MDGFEMDDGGTGNSLDEMLEKLSERANKISRTLDRTPETGREDVSVNDFLHTLQSIEDASVSRNDADYDHENLPETIEGTAPLGEGLIEYYKEELRVRDSILMHQIEKVDNLNNQIDSQQESIDDLQEILLDVQSQVSHNNAPGHDEHSIPQSSFERDMNQEKPVYTDVEKYNLAEHTQEPVRLPSVRELDDVYDPSLVNSAAEQSKELSALDETMENILEPQDPKDILRKGGGAKLYDI